MPFGPEGFVIGAGDIAAERIVKVFFNITLGAGVSDPDGLRLDAIRPQLMGQP